MIIAEAVVVREDGAGRTAGVCRLSLPYALAGWKLYYVIEITAEVKRWNASWMINRYPMVVTLLIRDLFRD